MCVLAQICSIHIICEGFCDYKEMLQHSTSKRQLTLGSGETGEEDFTGLYERGGRYVFRAQKILKAFESLKRLMH